MQKKVLISLLGSALLVFGCDDGSSGSGSSGDSNTTDPSGGESSGGSSETMPTTDPTGESDSDSNTTDNPTTGESDTDDPTAGSDTEDPTGIGFISDPDGGGVSIECSIWDQDCGEGEKCAPWANDGGSSWNATKCVAVDANPAQPGDPCTVEGSGVSGVDTCDVSSMCWDVDPETNMGSCVAFCTGSENAPTCDNPDTSCSIANEGVLVLCLPTCDPLLTSSCPDGQACYPIDASFVCAPDASGEDAGADNDPCEYINACDPGTICVNPAIVDGCPAGAGGCCQFVCDLSEDAAAEGCTADESCEPWYEEGMVPPGYEDVGVCALPA
jgi:hypothetical protein